MSTEGTATTAETAATAATTATTEVEKPRGDATGSGQHDPAWFNERIAQAKRSAVADTLKDLGVDTVEVAKASIAKAKALEDEKKSEIEKANEKAKELEPKAAKASDYEARLVRYADSELGKLTEEQKAAVLKLADNDKTRVLDVIETMRPTWAAQAATTTTTATEDASKKKLPAGANTTAAGAAPASDKKTPTTDHKATYEALKNENPMKAARYAQLHSRDIYK